MDQYNGRGSEEIVPHKYNQLIFEKLSKGKHNGTKAAFSKQIVLRQLNSHMQKHKSRHRPFTLYKNELKMDDRQT